MNKIKRIGWLVVLCCQVALLLAQEANEGVQFVEGKSFAEVLTQAKAEKKKVFVDCYTSWCGPCRKMAKEVFPLKEMGDYVNARFVSVKIDMEKGEGVELCKRYDVNAYPTLLFLDSDGTVLHRMLGFQTAEAFRQGVESGLADDGMRLLKQRYQEGDRSAAFLESYLAALAEQRMMNERRQVMKDYLADKAEAMLTDTLAFRFFNEMLSSPKDSLFLYAYDRKEAFAEVYGEWVLDKWWRVWYDYPEWLRLNVSDDILFKPEVWQEYEELMKQHRVDHYASISLYYKMYAVSLQHDWKQTLALAKTYADSGKVWDFAFVHICSRLLQYLTDETERAEVLEIVGRRLHALEGVEDLPDEASLYYVEGKRVGPIGRSRAYYRNLLP